MQFGNHDVAASFDTLMRQATMTVSDFLAFAIRETKEKLEPLGMQPTPELIAEVMKAAQEDFRTAMMKLAAQDIRDGLVNIGDAIREHASSTE